MNQIVAENQGLRALASNVQIDAAGIRAHSLAEVMDFGQLMAKAGPMVGKAFRGNPGACVGIAMQAMRWGMDPFAVSQKAYVTTDKFGNENIGYEAQLVAAVINSNAPVSSRPTIEFKGQGNARVCIVRATLAGESIVREYESPKIGDITTKNSPLWKSDPDQQLAYYSTRAWARRWCPEILLGVYTVDELAEAAGAPQEARVIDLSAGPAAISAPTAPSAPATPVETAEFTDAPPAPVADRSPIEDEISNSLLDAENETDVDTIWGFFADAIQNFDAEQKKRIDQIFADARTQFTGASENETERAAMVSALPAEDCSATLTNAAGQPSEIASENPTPGATAAEADKGSPAPASAAHQMPPEPKATADEKAREHQFAAFKRNVANALNRTRLMEVQTLFYKSEWYVMATEDEQEAAKQIVMEKLRALKSAA